MTVTRLNLTEFVCAWYQKSLPQNYTLVILGCWHILTVLKDSHEVRNALVDKSQRNYDLPTPYQSLNRVLGLKHSLPTCLRSGTAEWLQQHQELARRVATIPMTTLVEKHGNQFRHMLIEAHEWYEPVNQIVAKVWLEATFGCADSAFVSLAFQIQQSLHCYMETYFHHHWVQYVPFFGPFWTQLCLLTYGKQRKALTYIWSQIDSLVALGKSPGWLFVSGETSPNIIREWALLSFLVWDFLFETTLEYAASLPGGAVARAYFYPWRVRRTGVCSFTVVNLVTSELYWSAGPRACVGQVISKQLMQAVRMATLPLEVTCDWPHGVPRLNSTPWRPIALRHIPIQSLSLSRNWLASRLPSLHTDGRQLFHVNSAFYDPLLVHYATNKFAQLVRASLHEGLANAVLVSPEARGWTLAGALASSLQIPLVLCRKGGKEKGTAVHQTVYKTVYSKETLEVAQIAPLNLHSQVVLIDDGVSSGGSMNALEDLVTQFGASVVLRLALIRYAREANHSDPIVDVQTLFDV